MYDRPCKGRQILWLTYECFAVSGSHEHMLQLADLMKVAWTKSSEMAGFLDRWEKVVNRLQFRLTDKHLRDVFLIQLRMPAALKHQLEQWGQMPDDDPNKTCDWLVGQLQRKTGQRRERVNLQDLQVTTLTPGKPAAAAPEPPKAKP